MIHLVRVELARFRARRVIALLILLAALLAALVAAKSAWDTRPFSDQEIATAQAEAKIAAQRADIKADIDRCLADPEQYLGVGATAQACRDTLTAGPKSFLPREPLSLTGTLNGNGLGVALVVAGLLVIAASTFAGSDWASGSMVTQLVFEPRRHRVWAAKAIAVTLASGLVAVGRDIPHDSAVMSDVGWHLMRAVLLTMGAALGSFALTMIFRHSVATLALLFAYSVGGEILAFLVPVDNIGRWTLGNNIFGWLETRMEYFDPTSRCARLGNCDQLAHIGHLQGGTFLLALLGVTVILSLVTFRHRDVSAV